MDIDVPPPMPGFPPLPPVKKDRTNAVIIGSAAAVIATLVIVGVTVSGSSGSSSGSSGSSGDEAKPQPTVTVTETVPADGTGGDTGDVATEDTEPAAEESGDEVYALDDTVTYETGVEVTLSRFTRATSGQYAAPANAPYAKFNVKIKNGGSEKLDTTLLTVNCSYGKDGESGEAIFDSDANLGGGPSTQLLPGRSINVPWGCELPKGEALIQIEVTPDFDSETAIFTGTVK